MHAFTNNPEQITSKADIVVTDVGIPNMVRGDWLKPGAVVIDMGTNLVKVSGRNFAFVLKILKRKIKLSQKKNLMYQFRCQFICNK